MSIFTPTIISSRKRNRDPRDCWLFSCYCTVMMVIGMNMIKEQGHKLGHQISLLKF